ncbi:hypothetical protein RB213_007037 [Colletotrichum asianum]|uniref:Uncharacterized protein n=1 Tax=Colletotrichum asianum TaxID=702518 RepID=A0A8H3ZL57_9PEZI|nr:hypothetical protein GQ607_009275 [Colletotrichum asianum]
MPHSSASSSSGSSRPSSRSSSASSLRSGSSKKSRSSQVSHSTIKSDHWAVSFMKWTTGAPLGKPLSLRRTKVHEIDETWGLYQDDASIYSDCSHTHYAWVTPRFDDSMSEIASRTSSRSSGRLRREHRSRAPPRFGPSPAMHPPPFFPQHPHPPGPPPPPFMPPQHTVHDYHGYEDDDDDDDDDIESGYEDCGTEPQFHSHPHPPFPPASAHPPAPGGEAPFIVLNGGGGGGAHKYTPW